MVLLKNENLKKYLTSLKFKFKKIVQIILTSSGEWRCAFLEFWWWKSSKILIKNTYLQIN